MPTVTWIQLVESQWAELHLPVNGKDLGLHLDLLPSRRIYYVEAEI